MPPWPSRLLSSGTTLSNAQLSSSDAHGLRQTDLEVTLPPRGGIPILHTSPIANSPPNISTSFEPGRHGRSLSHPFPTLFGISKRTEKKPKVLVDEAELDLANNHAEIAPSMHLPRSPSRKGQPHSEVDFVTGNCATCDSTVRWPRSLTVYRCTVCLMVNDLKPAAKENQNGGTSLNVSGKQKELLPSIRTQNKTPALSVETTRKLIDQCILSYLRNRVDKRRTYERCRLDNLLEETIDLSSHSEGRTVAKTDLQIERNGRPLATLTKADNSHSPQYVTYDHSYKASSSSYSADRSLPHKPRSHVGPPPSRSPPSPPRARREQALLNTSEDIDGSSSIPTNRIFRQLENYLMACMSDCDCINASFTLSRPPGPIRSSSENSTLAERSKKPDSFELSEDPVFEVDAKTLLLGDIGENGTWWTGGRRQSQKKSRELDGLTSSAERKILRFDWNAIHQWYDAILTSGTSWRIQRQHLHPSDAAYLLRPDEECCIDEELAEARYHVHRTFLKAIETLLRRPGRPLEEQEDCRFLLILISNPLLYPHTKSLDPVAQRNMSETSVSVDQSPVSNDSAPQSRSVLKVVASRGGATGQHSGIVKRLLGLISNRPLECHQAIISWLCRVSEPQFRDMVELVGGFVSYRLNRHTGRQRSSSHDPTAGLIPSMFGPGAGTSAHLHATIGVSRQSSSKTPKDPKDKAITYGDDWQIRVAAKVMSLLFSANIHGKSAHSDAGRSVGDVTHSQPTTARQRALKHHQLLPTSAFYNTLIDYSDLIADFEAWESRQGKFSFCQYPMFLSIWAKIHIMEHDARRQMELKARDAFFTSILSRKAVSQHLVLKVRRDCLVDDSLRSVSEVVGTGQEEIKKGLRIEFVGEEGVDAGGLRKEWFLLLVREVFDPDHGLFVYDDDSNYCYFNPNSFETSDQFFLVGVVFGLAIYNSTILDVALPPFAFRKLLASAPNYTGPSTTAIRPSQGYTLDDLAEWKPSLAKGLRQLLEHEGNVEEMFCRDFVADVERYGEIIQVQLCPNGGKRPVTNTNRREFVDLYIRYMLDTAVARQYEPFKRGFFTVCGGNALSLFRPEEIELLVRGSDEPLDVGSLRAVAIYENWQAPDAPSMSHSRGEIKVKKAEHEVVKWFWNTFDSSDTRSQRKLLTFITGSDRIPAMGTTSLVIKITCLTEDFRRFPIARTCFNMLGLHKYRSKQELESKLWRAVLDSEGFGLK